MESFQLLMSGFATVLQPTNLLFAVMGCFLGTLIGVLPGIGPAAGIAILLPVTFALDPTPAIIMLAAIFYGGAYGGTITSVLINTPGEASSAITCLEGYEMAKHGRAGAALSIAAIGSFIGGTFAVMALVLVALPLTAVALTFGSPELFAVIVMALSMVTALAGKSLVRGLMSALLGLLVGMVGIDPTAGSPRFTFGVVQLLDGFNFIPVVMGLFGIGEIFLNAESPSQAVFASRLSSLWLSTREWRDSAWPIARGTVIGFIAGIIPGLGATVASFMSYIAEKRLSRTPEKFGTGMIEGVAGPETANNACMTAHLIPLFTLGLPTSASTAILMGAFMINGLIPGPLLFRDHAQFVWAVVASLYVGNVILLILNLPLIPMWVALLRIPYSILFALVLLFCVVGAYGLSNNIFDVGVMLAFGVLGYIFKKLDFPLAPLVLTLVLGPMMERSLRESLDMSQGDYSIFFTRPLSAVMLAIAVLVTFGSTFRLLSRVNKESEA